MSGEQKITFGEMRAAGVRQVLIYCADHRCSHCTTVEACADRWPDELRLSDIESIGRCLPGPLLPLDEFIEHRLGFL